MQPLKRFTQCGSLTMLFAVFIVLFGVSSTALTTFGKTNIPPATQGPVVKGKECVTHDDCASIQHTSCVKDPNDYKHRCLCGDDNAPINGLCSTTLKGLRHKCTSTGECEDGMVCSTEVNGTKPGLSKNVPSKVKMCLCDAENGYEENFNDSICNGGILLVSSSSTLVTIAFVMLSVLAYCFQF